MSDKPIISIIVPVYNVEKYIHKCIDSILSQSYTDFEVLLIDDGSTDSSGIICDEYARKDARIRVFHKENGGVSSARNIGILNAKGKYSIHVDADDWIEINMLQMMFSQIKKRNSDMLIVDYFKNNNKKQNKIIQKPSSLNPYDCICDILTGNLMGSTCNKLVKHELYMKHNICFPTNINYCEDCMVVIQLLLQANKIDYLNEAFYHYNYNPSSITAKPVKTNLNGLINYNYHLDTILGHNLYFKEAIIISKIKTKSTLLRSRLYTSKEYDEIFPEISKYILKLKYDYKYKILLWLASKHLWTLNKIVIHIYQILKYISSFLTR